MSSSIVTVSSSSTAGGGCVVQHELPTIALTVDGVAQEPNSQTSTPLDVDIQGLVEPSDEGTIAIDTCAPNAGCTPSLAVLEIAADNLPTAMPLVPAGAFVRLHFYADYAPAAVPVQISPGYHVLVQNLPTWNELANPVSTNERLWLAAESHGGGGDFQVPADLDPFTIQRTPSSCSQGATVVYGSNVDIPNAPPIAVDVGAQGSTDATGTMAAHYTFQSLESSEDDSGITTGYWLISH